MPNLFSVFTKEKSLNLYFKPIKAPKITKNKTKIARKHREKVPTGEVFSADFNNEQVEEAPAVEVVRTKNIELKPMDVEEAILQMELLGHDFFIYTDSEDHTTNVLYKREDGNYGLIEAK